MKNTLKLVFLFSILYVANSSVQAQTENTMSIIPSIPTSPQAEAFSRYGEYSINYQTGVPDISIPLYEIDHFGYKLPVVLKYYPQPLKPGYNYDVFGHGWSLSVNSCISRTIEGIPDEWKDFKLDTEWIYNNPFSFMQNGGASTFTTKNFVHDKFHAVLPNGYGFDFIIDGLDNKNRPVFKIGGSRSVKMSCVWNSYDIQSFTVTDEDGVIYTFEEGDTPVWFGEAHWSSSSYVSWQLVRIDLPNSPYPIEFNYGVSIESSYNYGIRDASVKMSHWQINSNTTDPTAAVGWVVECNLTPAWQLYNYKMKLLTSISGGGARIDFVYKYPNMNTTHNYVEKIRISEGTDLIEVDLAMTEADLYIEGRIPLAKLNSITIKSPQSSDAPQIYSCTYSGLAPFEGIDHWGFLNRCDTKYRVSNFNLYVVFDPNQHANGRGITLINKSPQDICPYYKIKLSNSDMNWDNRHPALPDEHDVLSRLQFPTGGYTDFEFENHKFLTSTDSEGNYIHDAQKKRITEAGGFRIKKIANYDSDGKVTDVKNFRYGKTYSEVTYEDNVNFGYSNNPYLHTGVGEAVVDPNILTYMNYSAYLPFGMSSKMIREMVLGLHKYNQFKTSSMLPAVFGWGWECEFSSANFRKLLNGRPSVIYPEVTVYYGEIGEDGIYTPEKTTGKTVYKYDIYDYLYDGAYNMDNPGYGFFESPKYCGNTLVYDPKSYRYNNLNEKIDYKFDGQSYKPVNKEINDWWYYDYNNLQYYDCQYTNPYPSDYPSEGDQSVKIRDFFQDRGISDKTALLELRTITNYTAAGDSLITKEEYFYNERNQLIGKDIKHVNSEGIGTDYYYPEIKPNVQTPAAIQKLIDKNMLSSIIKQETKTWSGSGFNRKTISGYEIDYKEFDTGNNTSVIMPEKLSEWENSTYVLSTQVFSYTKNGKPQEVVTRDGVHTVYLWGYSNLYLIAEIKNATLAQVSNAVQSVFNMSIEELAAKNVYQLDVAKLKNLRNNVNLSNAFVTAYTYGPWGKVTSITDPRGVTITYERDSFGRLQTIKDDNNKIIESYEYHYKD
ncbi:MAG: RHS repeat protein [Dysgonamonadaceae bacterium]|jgi:YD repeat-containing protein|nr:RHS repeat protein [Dysgonamonadaceae bacterium]